jgi:hypothetical protein
MASILYILMIKRKVYSIKTLETFRGFPYLFRAELPLAFSDGDERRTAAGREPLFPGRAIASTFSSAL